MSLRFLRLDVRVFLGLFWICGEKCVGIKFNLFKKVTHVQFEISFLFVGFSVVVGCMFVKGETVSTSGENGDSK